MNALSANSAAPPQCLVTSAQRTVYAATAAHVSVDVLPVDSHKGAYWLDDLTDYRAQLRCLQHSADILLFLSVQQHRMHKPNKHP